MKQFIKKAAKAVLSVGLAVVMGVSVALAETASATLNGSTNATMIVLGPGKLNSISISSLSATNGTLFFYDSPYMTNSYIVGAFTNITGVSGMVTNIYTNFFGRLETNRYAVKTYTTNTLTGAARTRQLLHSVATVSNTVYTVDFDGIFFGGGLLVTNISQLGGVPGSVVISVNYDRNR